jgi:threonine dehydrogenase-like Zn-dependent dehydrogenase
MECLRIGLELAAAGRLELGSLVTHRYSLEETDRAFQDYESKPDGYIKGLILP